MRASASGLPCSVVSSTGDVFGAFADKPSNLVQYSRALIHVDGAPMGKALCRRLQRLIEIGSRCQRQFCQHFACRRIDNLVRVAAFAAAPAAVDVKAQFS